jgi:hypothetical protein
VTRPIVGSSGAYSGIQPFTLVLVPLIFQRTFAGIRCHGTGGEYNLKRIKLPLSGRGNSIAGR